MMSIHPIYVRQIVSIIPITWHASFSNKLTFFRKKHHPGSHSLVKHMCVTYFYQRINIISFLNVSDFFHKFIYFEVYFHYKDDLYTYFYYLRTIWRPKIKKSNSSSHLSNGDLRNWVEKLGHEISNHKTRNENFIIKWLVSLWERLKDKCARQANLSTLNM